ncbi:hypothetical protein ACR77J_07865 [Tissierella praeacuta]
MIKIITTKKSYMWNWKQLLKNLAITVGIIYYIAAYLYLSTVDYLNFYK